MSKASVPPLPDTPFWQAYQGRFSGILNWTEVDDFWGRISAISGDWFIFEPGEPAPENPAATEQLTETLASAQALINSRRDMSHCGAIYVDNVENPSFIKVFDPSAMGSSCNISGIPILPRWIISRIKPDNLPAPIEPAKPSLLKRLTGLG